VANLAADVLWEAQVLENIPQYVVCNYGAIAGEFATQTYLQGWIWIRVWN